MKSREEIYREYLEAIEKKDKEKLKEVLREMFYNVLLRNSNKEIADKIIGITKFEVEG